MKKVTIVGAGALGSHVAMLLRNEAELKVIDFDRVEQKNVQAQFHNKGSVGRNKTESLRGLMLLLWGNKVEAVPHKLVANNAHALLVANAPELVIDCLDNGEGRRTIQAFVRSPNNMAQPSIPCLHGALAADGTFGRVVWDEHFVIDDESATGAATCEGGEHLPFIVVTAAYLARSAQVFLQTGKRIGWQLHAGGATRT